MRLLIFSLNFAYFIDVFEKFEHKFIIEYDFNFYCENPNNINYYFAKSFDTTFQSYMFRLCRA